MSLVAHRLGRVEAGAVDKIKTNIRFSEFEIRNSTRPNRCAANDIRLQKKPKKAL